MLPGLDARPLQKDFKRYVIRCFPPFMRLFLAALTAASARFILGVPPRATRIDVASVAGTVDLTANAPDTDDIRITGALAITGFTVAVGRVLRVTAGGAFTLTNGAGLVTQTGANIVAVVGDTFLLRATAANVMEVLNYVPVTVTPVIQATTRQTVLSGPVDTSGLPTFLPATSASLNITSQNVSTGVNALVATASGGANANGIINVVGQATANLTWTGCTANQTNYLPVSIAGGVLTAQTPTILQPIEQWGGTPSVTSGQYTYNVQQKIMYLGNGTTAPAVNHVIVGEVVAGASTITSTAAYAYESRYYSEQASLAVSTAYSKTHNIGSKFLRPLIYVECVTNDATNGCVVGDRILLAQGTASGGGNPTHGVFTGVNRLTTFATTGGSGLLLFGKATGYGNTGSTIANYKLVFDIGRAY